MAAPTELATIVDQLKQRALGSHEAVSYGDALEFLNGINKVSGEDDLKAAVARANAYAMGELIANEYETPASEVDEEVSGCRSDRIKYWVSVFAPRS